MDLDRLPVLSAKLARRQVAVIVATGALQWWHLAAKAASTTIPIVFTTPEDPVRVGLVASLARPGGNATGINFFSNEVLAKRLELLRELVPVAARFAVLVNPVDAANAETILRDVDAAEPQNGAANPDRKCQYWPARLMCVFATFMRERPDALFVSGGPLFVSRRVQLALLAARHAIPASYGSE